MLRRGATPSLDVCLRLADMTGTSPSRVLHAAARGDIADIIEELYGPTAARRRDFQLSARRTHYTSTDTKFLELIGPLSSEVGSTLTILMNQLYVVNHPSLKKGTDPFPRAIDPDNFVDDNSDDDA
jgi:hypothetical protein